MDDPVHRIKQLTDELQRVKAKANADWQEARLKERQGEDHIYWLKGDIRRLKENVRDSDSFSRKCDRAKDKMVLRVRELELRLGEDHLRGSVKPCQLSDMAIKWKDLYQGVEIERDCLKKKNEELERSCTSY
uniref:Uncharacterized protein n=1 Tax=Eutreptiella gymnastica TaxID=73025 RepID=A0A7S1N1E4_9EUGL|mmetsp:Transcript_102733/g.177325  ORF Transcript_102733/g.177325 Transcript_102733/m.177325 type:complete len:132 (+) Transcript_102733:786-1181(+)